MGCRLECRSRNRWGATGATATPAEGDRETPGRPSHAKSAGNATNTLPSDTLPTLARCQANQSEGCLPGIRLGATSRRRRRQPTPGRAEKGTANENSTTKKHPWAPTEQKKTRTDMKCVDTCHKDAHDDRQRAHRTAQEDRGNDKDEQ